MEFCELWIDKINENPNIKNYLFFTDEKMFTLDGKVHTFPEQTELQNMGKRKSICDR
jgi:hypothetical protein